MKADVDILVSELGYGDATSNHTREMQKLLQNKSLSVRIVVGRHPRSQEEVIPMRKLRSYADTVILQHSIGSQVAQMVIEQNLPIILNYHNITPPTFIGPWDGDFTYGVTWGRDQLTQLVPLTRRAITDSEFNAYELAHAGFSDISVVPVLCPLPDIHTAPHIDFESTLFEGHTILFVGRVSPNKCHEDIIFALKLLLLIQPQSRVVFVGEPMPTSYLTALEALVKNLCLSDYVQFLGKVTDEELKKWYHLSDVFVCTSEHEGFGVPLVEAMAHGVPVIAYDAAAVGETVGSAGVVLRDKRPTTLAIALDRVLRDRRLHTTLSERGISRASQFDISITAPAMWKALEDII